MTDDSDRESLSAIRQRIINSEERHSELRGEVRDLADRMSRALNDILQKLDQKTTVNWAPIGILMTAAGVLLTLFVNSQLSQSRGVQDKQDAEIKEIRVEMVSRAENDRAWSIELERDREIQALLRKQAEDSARIANDLAYTRGQLHPLKRQD